jgi:putative ABC transport system permease protein
MEQQPPRWARRLLAWYCKPHLLEEIEGDLNELFAERIAAEGKRAARRQYVWDVVRYLRPHTLHRQAPASYAKPLYTDMLRNYVIVALRHLSRNKVYSLLNVTGLASGIAVCLLILLFVQHELSYDSFHGQAERVYRVNAEFMYGGQTMHMDGLSAAVAPAMQRAHADIAASVRLSGFFGRVLTGRPGRVRDRFYEDKWLFADQAFLSVFSFKLLAGDRRTALARPNTVLITPEMARKYFGGADALGKTLSFFRNPHPYQDTVKVSREYTFTVTGIIEPPPSNSTLEYEFVASFSSLATLEKDQYYDGKFGFGSYPTYFLLRSPAAAPKVAKALDKAMPPFMDTRPQFFLTKLTDLHLRSRTSGSGLMHVYIFFGLALLILLLALINYISLTTARATQRAREVGIRKVVGAGRGQLVRQFFGESLLMTGLAFAVSVLLVALLLPPFYRLVGVTIPVGFLWHPRYLVVAGSILLLSGLIAGSYPALLLSRFLPTAVLKGRYGSGPGSAGTRRVLTVFQLTASIALIMCSMGVGRQVSLLRNKDLGLNKEQLLVISIDASMGQKGEALRTELSRQPWATQVAASSSVPFGGYNMVLTETPDKRQIGINSFNIDAHFIPVYGIGWKLVTKAAEQFGARPNTVILNETAVVQLGLGEDPLGKKIMLGGEDNQAEVIGVVKDFHFASVQQAIAPWRCFPSGTEAGCSGSAATSPYGWRPGPTCRGALPRARRCTGSTSPANRLNTTFWTIPSTSSISTTTAWPVFPAPLRPLPS